MMLNDCGPCCVWLQNCIMVGYHSEYSSQGSSLLCSLELENQVATQAVTKSLQRKVNMQ